MCKHRYLKFSNFRFLEHKKRLLLCLLRSFGRETRPLQHLPYPYLAFSSVFGGNINQIHNSSTFPVLRHRSFSIVKYNLIEFVIVTVSSNRQLGGLPASTFAIVLNEKKGAFSCCSRFFSFHEVSKSDRPTVRYRALEAIRSDIHCRIAFDDLTVQSAWYHYQ